MGFLKILANNTKVCYNYDELRRLTSKTVKNTNAEQVGNTFKTYHFDNRGSTVAVTNSTGTIIDTFAYDAYGNVTSITGTDDIIFQYNGKFGVITDSNGLCYMRARYYSPTMHRFINADIVPGTISNAVTLNRFAFANANPISKIDPRGLFIWDWIEDNIVDPVVDTATEAANATADTYNAAKNWASNTAATVSDLVSNPQKAKTQFEDNVVNPIVNAVNSVVLNATEAMGELNASVSDIVHDNKNADVQKVYDSTYFSSYNGVFIVRHSSSFLTSWGIGNTIFLNHDEDPASGSNVGMRQINTLNHEYGHTKQFEKMGLGKYLAFVAIPSMTYNLLARDNQILADNYYNMPWEYNADEKGDVNRENRPVWAMVAESIYHKLFVN